MTVKELAEIMERSNQCTNKTVKSLHRQRLVHICGFGARDYPNGRHPALFKAGVGVDKTTPQPTVRAQINAEYRKRNRALILANRPSAARMELGVWGGLL